MYGIMFWKHWGCILLFSLQIHALNAKIKIYFHMFEDFYYRKRNLFILPPRKFCVCNEIRLQLYIKRSTQFDNRPLHRSLKKKILKTKLSCGYLGPISQLKQRNILRIFSRESTTGLWTCFMGHSPLDELFTFNKTADQSRGSCVMRFLIHGKWRFSHAGEQLLAVRLNQTHRNK